MLTPWCLGRRERLGPKVPLARKDNPALLVPKVRKVFKVLPEHKVPQGLLEQLGLQALQACRGLLGLWELQERQHP